MLRDRLIFGTILIIALIGGVWLDEFLEDLTSIAGIITLPLLLTVLVLAAVELDTMLKARDATSARLMTVAAMLAGLFTSALTKDDIAGFSGVALASTMGALVLIGSMMFYTRHKTTQGVMAGAGAALLAFVYLGLLGGFLFVTRREFEHGAWVVLGVLLVTKSSDIGAYTFGRLFGKHKLIPWLSPGKTWEGAIGGLALSALVSIGVFALAAGRGTGDAALPDVMWLHAALIGAVLGAVGQGGDLVASMLKRDAGVKDASHTLPGFGGIIDVLDSPLLVAPVAYWILTALNWPQHSM